MRLKDARYYNLYFYFICIFLFYFILLFFLLFFWTISNLPRISKMYNRFMQYSDVAGGWTAMQSSFFLGQNENPPKYLKCHTASPFPLSLKACDVFRDPFLMHPNINKTAVKYQNNGPTKQNDITKGSSGEFMSRFNNHLIFSSSSAQVLHCPSLLDANLMNSPYH